LHRTLIGELEAAQAEFDTYLKQRRKSAG
jgi:hypothetical protein